MTDENEVIKFPPGFPSDEELLRRAIKNVRSNTSRKMPRLFLVRNVFAVGKTSAGLLCERFDADPWEEV